MPPMPARPAYPSKKWTGQKELATSVPAVGALLAAPSTG